MSMRRFRNRAALAAACGVALIATVGATQAQADNGVPGGRARHASPETDENVMAATYFGLKESSKRARRTNFLGLAEVEKVKTETVAGTMYYIQVKAGESNCKVAEEATWTPEGCGAIDPANAKSCTMRVVHRAWQTVAPYELMGGTCKEL